MKFSGEKMIKRVKAEGRGDLINEEVLEMIRDLDGQEAIASCWRRVVHNDPVFWVVGKSGQGTYVNEEDCE